MRIMEQFLPEGSGAMSLLEIGNFEYARSFEKWGKSTSGRFCDSESSNIVLIRQYAVGHQK
jgi:hypothetical protein